MDKSNFQQDCFGLAVVILIVVAYAALLWAVS